MRTYLFEDFETGERFFVEEETPEKAIAVADEYFDHAIFMWEVSEEWADLAGFDTY